VARASVLVSALFYFLLGWLPILIGFAGRTLLPGLDKPELLFPYLAAQHFTPILTVVFIGGPILAIMSSADSYLLAGTSILTLNIVLPLLPQKSEKKRLVMLRICSMALTGVAFLLATAGFNIFQLVIHSGVMLFVAIFVPVTMTLYYKNASAMAAWCSIGCGVLSWLCFLFLGSLLFGLSGDALLYASATVGGAGSVTGYLVTVGIRHLFNANQRLPVEALDPA
jgi:Na+/proline symporter